MYNLDLRSRFIRAAELRRSLFEWAREGEGKQNKTLDLDRPPPRRLPNSVGWAISVGSGSVGWPRRSGGSIQSPFFLLVDSDPGDRPGPLPLPPVPLLRPPAAGPLLADGDGAGRRGGRHGRHGQGRQQGRAGKRRQAQQVTSPIHSVYARLSRPYNNSLSRSLAGCRKKGPGWGIIVCFTLAFVTTYPVHMYVAEVYLTDDNFTFLFIKYCVGFLFVILVPVFAILLEGDIRRGIRSVIRRRSPAPQQWGAALRVKQDREMYFEITSRQSAKSQLCLGRL